MITNKPDNPIVALNKALITHWRPIANALARFETIGQKNDAGHH